MILFDDNEPSTDGKPKIMQKGSNIFDPNFINELSSLSQNKSKCTSKEKSGSEKTK